MDTTATANMDRAKSLAELLSPLQTSTPAVVQEHGEEILVGCSDSHLKLLAQEIAQKTSQGYLISVVLLNTYVWGKLKNCLSPDVDRETEQRLQSLGVVGYLRGYPLIINQQVPSKGFVLV
jgi:hypothetical protein